MRREGRGGERRGEEGRRKEDRGGKGREGDGREGKEESSEIPHVATSYYPRCFYC